MALSQAPPELAGVKALAFDVFGTAFDWRGSIIREGEAWGPARGLHLDWARFADLWRAGYAPTMDKVRQGALPWTNLDGLHRLILDDLLKQFNVTGLTAEQTDHLNRVWHRLAPWPDVFSGLTRLKDKYVISTLSNGNVSLLIDLSKREDLPWDAVLSVELFRHYKPDREVYLGAAELLGCQPREVMMVACHPDDLEAARGCGLRTAFVNRPLEHGPEKSVEVPVNGFDLAASSFLNLADKLDC